MVQQGANGFLALNKTEDRFLIGALVCLFLSLVSGMQGGLIFTVLWGVFGAAAIICLYFAFPFTWPYGLLLYASYSLCALGVILVVFWSNQLILFELSIPIIIGLAFIVFAFYISFHIIQTIKRGRDANTESGNYLALGFWSVGVMLFPGLCIASIFGWALWVGSGGIHILIYQVFESLIAFIFIYILWLPDRKIKWRSQLPDSPATRFIVDKTRIVKHKVSKIRNVCPECGMKLKVEKKTCPSCGEVQNFGWCVKSEAYVFPCSDCGNMTLYGRDTCQNCGKTLKKAIGCSSCLKEFPVKDWIVET